MPIVKWLPGYRRAWLRGDLLAGLTVGVMLVPQGMAYGLLAGLPPIYGLYASILPLMLYALFGTSRQLSVGPVALVSLLVVAGVSRITGGETGTAEFIALAVSTALLAGIIQILLGAFRLGFLINFLSHPVIAGFTSAAAFIIGFSQIKNLLGLPAGGNNNTITEIVVGAAQQLHLTHVPTLALGLGGVVFMLALRRINKRIPGALLAVILSTLAVWLWQLHDAGVAVVGVVPKGLPDFKWPVLNPTVVGQLLPLALTICLISFIESLAIAKTLEARHKDYRIVPNQELIALGLTKIGGAFFQAYPTTGSFTRSAINDDAGAHTGLSSVFSAVLIALTLLFLTPLFYFLPKAILASVIVVAVINLVDYKEAIHLWKTDRRDWLAMMVTFMATLLLGIQNGVAAGILLSLAIMVYRNSRPHVAILGQLPGSKVYRNVDRFEEALQDNEILILRFDAQLYFGNAAFFQETIENLVEKQDSTLRVLVLDASSIHDIDSSGIQAVNEILQFLHARGIELYLAAAIGPVRDILHKNHLLQAITPQHHFLDVHSAVEYYRHQSETGRFWSPAALQTNQPQ